MLSYSECEGTFQVIAALPLPFLVRYRKWSRRRSRVVRQGFAKYLR
jgi:hypothetical protein